MRVLGKCCHITLNTGAEAFYLNGLFITDREPSSGAPSLLNLARSISMAAGYSLSCYVVKEPDGDEWAWNDVADQIVVRASIKPAPLFTRPLRRIPGGI